MPQNEQRKNSKSMKVSPRNHATAGNRLCERERWSLKINYAQLSEDKKNIFHYFLDTNLAIPGIQAHKPQHLSTTEVLPTLCSASGHKGMPRPSPRPAGLSFTLGSHFSPNLLICGVIQSPTWFQIKQVTR